MSNSKKTLADALDDLNNAFDELKKAYMVAFEEDYMKVKKLWKKCTSSKFYLNTFGRLSSLGKKPK